MTQREKILSILIGSLIGIVGLQWMFNKYRDAKLAKTNQIASLQEKSNDLNMKLLQGAMAERQMGEYRVRSLPGDPENAVAAYNSWLMEWVKEAGLVNPEVRVTGSTPNRELYRQYRFTVAGTASLPEAIELLHAFYLKDYMHRISGVTIKPDSKGDLKLDMRIDALGLNTVPADVPPPASESWRVDSSLVAYQEAILNRNFFEPPNKAPEFRGSPQVEAIVGSRSPATLQFEDAENHPIRYEIAGKVPEFVELDGDSGTLQMEPKQTGEFEILVRAIDAGYPSRTTEQLVKVKVGDPPVVVEEEPEPEFDHARQTVLTALLTGGDDWEAWMNVRTSGKTLKLREGDRFEIGTVKGKVVEVTPKFVVIEVDDRRFTLSPNDASLSEAAKRAVED